MSVENLRASRKSYTAVFMDFTRLYKQSKSALCCFFEGEDSQYYGIRIDSFTEPKEYHYLTCDGKDGVLAIYEMISSDDYYKNARCAYFVDKDFDRLIEEKELARIYVTPCYSIENFYTSLECFSKILKSEFKLNELNKDYLQCISLYKKRQSDFHDAIELLNAWIACQKERSSKLNISKLSISEFVHVELDKIIVKYTISDLERIFPDLPNIPQDELDIKKCNLNYKIRQKSFRGKFEIEFLCNFLQKLKDEANQKNSSYFAQKIKVNLHFSKKTIISDLSQYADTSDCLRSYLKSIRKS